MSIAPPGAESPDIDAPTAIPRGDLVSCLMVTRNRLALVKRSVGCFQAQTHSVRELIIVDDGFDDTGNFVTGLGDPRIRHLRVADEGLKLGELRNIAVAAAQGRFVANWDDDDWSHPDRLRVQLAALRQTNSRFCFLSRVTVAWPARNRFYHSKERCWECTMLALGEAMPKYPPLAMAEDTALAREIHDRDEPVCFVDNPELYVYAVHGKNTWPPEHFENRVFDFPSRVLTGADADKVSRALGL